MRKLVTGFIAGTLVTIAAMLAILGDRSDDAAPSGTYENGPAADGALDADAQDLERRRRSVRSDSSASAADSGVQGRPAARLASDASESDEFGSADCCSIAVVSDSGDSTDVDESVAAPFLVHSAPGQAPSRPFLTGKWEGVMTGVGAQPDGAPSVIPPFDEARGQYGFRLDIRQTNLVMYFRNEGQWIGLGEGEDLRTNEQGRSAIVITALNGANGGVEAMMLNIVRWNEDTIVVHISRVTGAGPSGGELPPPVNSMGILNRAVF